MLNTDATTASHAAKKPKRGRGEGTIYKRVDRQKKSDGTYTKLSAWSAPSCSAESLTVNPTPEGRGGYQGRSQKEITRVAASVRASNAG